MPVFMPPETPRKIGHVRVEIGDQYIVHRPGKWMTEAEARHAIIDMLNAMTTNPDTASAGGEPIYREVMRPGGRPTFVAETGDAVAEGAAITEARARKVLAAHGIVEGFNPPTNAACVVVNAASVIRAMLAFAASASTAGEKA